MKKRTVSIKRTVWEIFLMTLLNVPYDPKIKTIIALSYRTYNRVFRVYNFKQTIFHFKISHLNWSKNQPWIIFFSKLTITLIIRFSNYILKSRNLFIQMIDILVIFILMQLIIHSRGPSLTNGYKINPM